MPSSLRDAIAAEVRAEMARQCKNQRDLGGALGLPQASVSKRLSGATPFRAEELVVVANFLRVPLTQFTGSEPGATSPAPGNGECAA